MAKKKHSALGKRLIASAKGMAPHARGELRLEEYEVRVPPQVDVLAIRKRLGLSQAEFARRFGFSPRAVQDWEQGRRKPESAARAYLLVNRAESEGGGSSVEKGVASVLYPSHRRSP
jgi:putative transcriptional regulator